MATNMNIRPYYDDFSEDSNYYRILFRPSFSVQARELTQLQTILSDQVSKVGNSLLDDGDVLSGGEMSYDSIAKTVTVKDGVYYLNGMAINVDIQDPIVVGDDQLVGFLVVEEFVNAGSDDTLYDNAAGSPNYRGPGADRFKVGLELVSRDEVIEDEIFIEIFRLINGEVYQSQSTASTIITEEKYSEKVKKSDGDYVLDAFDIDIKSISTTDSGVEDSYKVSINDGIAIIDGKEVEVETAKSITIPKAREDLAVNRITANVETGQYAYIIKEGASGINFGVPMALQHYDGAFTPVGAATPTHIAAYDETFVKLFLTNISYVDGKTSTDVTHLSESDAVTTGAVGLHVVGGEELDGGSNANWSGFSFQGTDNQLFKLSAGSVTSMQDLIFEGRRIVQKQSGGTAQEFEITSGYVNVKTAVGTGNFVDLDSVCLVITLGGVKKSYTSNELFIDEDGSTLKFSSKDSNKTFSTGVGDNIAFYSSKVSFGSTATKELDYFYKAINNTGWNGVTPLDTRVKLRDSEVISFVAMQYTTFDPNYTNTVTSGIINDLSDWTDVTSDWMLESTDTDSEVNDSYITLRPTALDPDGVVLINYTYWKSTGSDKIFHGGSYDSDHFDKLSSYIDSDGNEYTLADVLDLRQDDKIFYNCKFEAKGTVNGKRMDSLVLRSDGNLVIVESAKYIDKIDNNFIENGIKLYDLNLHPYDGIDFIRTHGVRNVNYIHNLGKRISNLEDKIIFSPLETEALSTDVGTKVIEGVMVDGFRGIGKSKSQTIAVDYIENELRPDYAISKGDIVSSGSPKVVTLPVDSSISDIANLQTSGSILINEPKNTIYHISLDPITWYDENQLPMIMSDPDNYFSGMDNTTVWNGWQHFWYGSLDDSVYSSSINVDNKGRRLLGNNFRPYVTGKLSGNITPSFGSSSFKIFLDKEEQENVTVSGPTFDVDLPPLTLSGKKLVEIKNGDSVLASNYLYARGFGQIGQEKSLEGIVQEFDVITDTFYTKVDLYFDTIDTQHTVFVQIKDMNTGDIVPYSTVNSAVTVVGKQTFTFNETILLKSGKYGLVVSTSSDTAKLTTGVYGGSSVGPLNGNKLINLKFNLYRADFTKTERIESLTINAVSNSIDKIFLNENYMDRIKVYQPTHNFSTTEQVTLGGFLGNLVQDVEFVQDQADDIDVFVGNVMNQGDNIIGLNAFQQLADVSVDQIEATPSAATLLNASTASYNYGKVIGWNSSTRTLTFEMTAGSFSKETTSGQGLVISIHQESYTSHFLPSTVQNGTETSISGVSSSELNNTFNVISRTNDSYVLEATTSGSFTPTVTGFYSDPNMKVVDSDIRSDMLYLNATKYLPVGASEKWDLMDGSAVVMELSPNSNTYLQTPLEINSYSIGWTISSDDSRVSPVLYTDCADLLIVSNLLDSSTATFSDTNMNWVRVPVTGNDNNGNPYGIGVRQGVLGKISEVNDQANEDLDVISGLEVGNYLMLDTGATKKIYTVLELNSTGLAVVGGTGINVNSQSVHKLYKLAGHVNETHRTDGSSLSKYISPTVNFNNSINGIRVDFDAICPTGNWIEVYYSDGKNPFVEIPIKYPESGVSSTYQSFSYEAVMEYISNLEVKIVMKGTDTIGVPKIKNLKIIGLNDYEAVVPSTTTEVITLIIDNIFKITYEADINAIVGSTSTFTLAANLVSGNTGAWSIDAEEVGNTMLGAVNLDNADTVSFTPITHTGSPTTLRITITDAANETAVKDINVIVHASV